MANFTVTNPDLGTAVVGFASTVPSSGKTISASVVNDGFSAYDFTGDISGSNPDFSMYVGDELTLSINASGHPFWIQTSSGAYSGITTVTDNISNNGTQSGTLTWNPISPGTYYYVCQYHGGMNGTITVSTVSYTVQDNSSDTSNRSFTVDETRPGWLTGRRPSQGQLFPRGIYNK